MNQKGLTGYQEGSMKQKAGASPEQLKGSYHSIARISTVLHLYLYIAVMGLLILIWSLTVMARGLIFFWPFFAIFGWGFACGYHIILYLSYSDKIPFLSKIRERPYLGVSLITHGWFYFSINLYLVVLNILFSSFPWSAFVIIGWGIAFGIHVIIFSLTGTQNQKQIEKIEINTTNYCHTCGAELANRPGAKFCAFCGINLQD